jgi:hypothetical protein
MKVHGIICPHCKCFIFSRAVHDFRECACGKCAIDGGQELEYTRVIFDNVVPKEKVVELPVSKQDLYNDWNKGKDLFGIMLPVGGFKKLLEIYELIPRIGKKKE